MTWQELNCIVSADILAEIEGALEQHPDVVDVAVFGIPSEEWGEMVHAEVVQRPGASLSAEALMAFAREHLAGYKVPRSVKFIAEIPRTGTGKISRMRKNKSHILTKKDKKRKRRLRQRALVSSHDRPRMEQMLPS